LYGTSAMLFKITQGLLLYIMSSSRLCFTIESCLSPCGSLVQRPYCCKWVKPDFPVLDLFSDNAKI
jgi:hypothetical protein